MDGWEFIEKFEQLKEPALKKIHIFVYTSSLYSGDINKAKSYKSLDNIYSKPLTSQMLMEMAETVNGTSR